MTDETSQAQAATVQPSSTLIEFPGVSRASRPQWRKELSERVREIQERRAREAQEAALNPMPQPEPAATAPQLGLVPPPPEAPTMNPIVANALKRLERARQPPPPMPRSRASLGGAAAAATARVAEEQYQTESRPSPVAAPPLPAKVSAPAQLVNEKIDQAKTAEPAREHALVVVPPKTAPKAPPASSKAQASAVATAVTEKVKITPAVDPASLIVPEEEIYDDRAPFSRRIVASLIDLLAVAFASSPFAAIIELTNGNWSDWRVVASMGGIVLVVMFLYLTAATALAGRTWGMSLVSLRAVDVETGLPPTTKQSVGRAILYVFSLITLGLGLLYALFDAEGRAVHDHLSGTVVVRES